MDITIKSTGYLIDELITTRFKVEISPTPEIIQRMRLLDAAIRLRLNGREDTIYLQVVKLQIILRQCWEAQEIVSKTPITNYTGKLKDIEQHQNLDRVAKFAKIAQETNAQRNKLIREIDTLLHESETSPLGKTYT